MSQSIAIMITASACHAAGAHTALNFTRSVIQQGFTVECLFFYHEGAMLGSQLTISPQDEINLPQSWQQLITEHNLPAIVCIASGLKRGIIDTTEARRYQKPASSMADSMELAGLGQWIEAVNNADQHIVFA